MTDEIIDPIIDQPEPQPARTLTEAELANYEARLVAVGYALEVEGDGTDTVGFRVTATGARYDYRYREGETAVELMDRICAERGA